MRVFLSAAAAAILSISASLAAAQSAKNQIDQTVVNRALTYLNGARTMEARFIQRDPRGGRWSGKLWLRRPGRLRFQYDPPENDVIWSTGGLVNHFDAELETVTHVPRHLTPAWFLLDDQVRINEDVTLLAALYSGDRYFVTAAQDGALAQGRVTLAFSTSPERLIGWTVTSEDGSITQVDLVDLVVGAPIDKDVFDYTPPIPDQ